VWYRSFYWRIAASFAALVVLVLVGQSAIVSAVLTRRGGEFAPGDPNREATTVAARVREALRRDDSTPLAPLVAGGGSRVRQSVYLVLTDGREAANTPAPLSPAIRAQVDAALRGEAPASDPASSPSGPVVTAPVQVDGALRGLVILPPPPRRGPFSEVGRLLSLPGTLVLLLATALVGAALFLPFRRRLRALEHAAARIGAGERDVHADQSGRDEIAGLAAAFNRMSAELSARAEALQASDRVRRQMLADISHELRTPLTSMRGYLDTLALPDVPIDDDTRARYLETARREAARLERIVSDLLDLARYEGGASLLELRLFAIERVFEHVMRRHEQDASVAGVSLNMHVAAHADQVLGDPGRIEQVIGNLVANALRHTPAGGTIRLEAALDNGGYRIVVEDSGTGIDPEHLPHVFDRFYKADHARAANTAGSGLGLSIAKAIVEQHHGRIAVESRPGRTAFTIRLPRAEAGVHCRLPLAD
jgi:two-component system sensor histidine kinase BaeS